MLVNFFAMKTNYIIRNSVPARRAQGCTYVEVKAAREGSGVAFTYSRKQPSTPSDVLTDCMKWVRVGHGSEDKALYTLKVQGTVDDSATVSMAGQTVQSGSGAGVPINGAFTDVAAGEYEVYVTHTNIAYPEKQNASFLSCTVGPAVEVVPAPNDNRPPNCTDPCNCPSPESGTPHGGGSSSKLRAASGDEDTEAQSSTSGGRGVSRTSSANDMAWTAQFGVFRGLAGMPTGMLSISCYEEYQPELGQPAGLRWQHPLGSSLALPEEGLAPSQMVELWDGHNLVNFLLDGTGARFFKIGASVGSNTELAPVSAMSREAEVECSIEEAAYIRAAYPSGAASFYDLEEGQCVGFISADGYSVSAEEAYAYIAIVREAESGTIRQIWNAWDGLADILPGDGNGYAIRIYPPAQVTAPAAAGELYSVAGDPVKTFSVSSDDAEKSLTIRERDHTLPESYGEMVSTWRWANGAWSMQEGEGDGAVITERVREDAEDGVHYSITVRQMKGSVAASCTREEYEKSTAGNLLLSSTAGYGEPGALTTTYAYNTAGQLTERREPGGGLYKTIYDLQGRVREESSPWGAGLSRTVQTTYRSDAPYSTDPARVRTTYFNGSSNPTMLDEVYTYSEADHVRRVEKRTTAAGVSGTRLSVEETWLADAPEPFAAGRPKMRQAENGVQTVYTYAAATQYGALYTMTAETQVEGAPVPGQSTRQVSYISAEGNTTREENYVMLGSGEWVLTSGASHTYDQLNRLIGTTWDNGRRMTRRLTCQGNLLEETNADGVTTHYTYDSARQLVETTRSAVYDGEVCITPETITEYERDGAGRVTRTTTYIGAMKTVTSTEYDLQGRIVKQVDELGRETLTAYSVDGLTTTVTTPAGATFITTSNTDGTPARLSGTGQREQIYKYDYINGLRTTVYLANGSTILSQSIVNGYGEEFTQTAPTTLPNTYLYTRSVYNALGQLTQRTVGAMAPTAYAYDSMGQQSRVTTLLSPSAPNDPARNVIATLAHSYEAGEDGEVYQVTTTQRNNAQGEWLTTVQKTLVSELSPTLESKQISIDEYGKTTSIWTEYGEGTERKSYRQLPTSDVVAENVSYDGFDIRSTDNMGITATATRTYRESGMLLTNTDGRGNTTTTRTDIARRPIEVTNAAGDTTTTLYEATSDNPAVITNALGNTTCYAYDVRGQKIAEWGTAVQPSVFEYNDAGLLIALTTWRDSGQVISTDPRGMTGGDTTRWAYNDATGLELRKTYADGRGSTRTYDAANRLYTSTDARNITTIYTYDSKTGLVTAIGFSSADAAFQQYVYDILGQPVKITDAAGARSLIYDAYGKLVEERIQVNESSFSILRTWDDYGRSTGYVVKQGNAAMHTVSWGYAADGRIGSASFLHKGAQHQFRYAYLPGADLLESLTMPNGIRLEQEYAAKRDLLTTMSYMRDATLVSRRVYDYDKLGRPTERTTSRLGRVISDTFGYDDRSQITNATLVHTPYAYAYDNIGNRITAQENTAQVTYTTNDLNQYTQIDTNGNDFTPEYDADGNQTLIQTSTGIWKVQYNAQNRAIRFENESNGTVITCDYDYMGRRIWKKVENANGTVTLHQRYIYYDYLQIAALDLTRATLNGLWLLTWDPSQAVATRPLAIQINGTWYTYGWDLTKNICELYTSSGAIGTSYTYTPYGTVSIASNAAKVTQSIQWSSEYHDAEIDLVYYNYRYYNPLDGRWTRRDPIEFRQMPYDYVRNAPVLKNDYRGLEDENHTYNFDQLIKSCLQIRITIELVGYPFNHFEEWKPGQVPERRIARMGMAIVRAHWKNGKSIDPCVKCEEVRQTYFREQRSSVVISVSWVTRTGGEIDYVWPGGILEKVFIGPIYLGETVGTGKYTYGEQALPISRRSGYNKVRVMVSSGAEIISDGVYEVRQY